MNLDGRVTLKSAAIVGVYLVPQNSGLPFADSPALSTCKI
jgi:hypothetical protein